MSVRSGDAPMITVCLTLNGGGKQVRSIASDASLADLHGLARSAFSFSESSAAETAADIELRAGFPPRTLDRTAATTVQQAGLRHQDRIWVTVLNGGNSNSKTTTKRVGSGGGAATQADEPAAETTTETYSVNNQRGGRPPRRAASQAAAAAFADEIKLQDAAARQLQQKPSRQKTTGSKQQSPPQQQARRHFAALARRSNAAEPAASETAPRRLRDGAAIVPTAAKRRRRTPATTLAASASEDGLAAALVGATQARPRSRAAQLMRAGWRSAVASAREQNRAAARAAAPLRSITIERRHEEEETGGDDDNNTAATTRTTRTTTFTVTYPRGVQGRGCYVDGGVDCLERPVLEAVLSQIHGQNPEGLRPGNLALLSPRVLWSLVHHCRGDGDSAATTTVGDLVAAALPRIRPALDWSFLRRRAPQPSAKARENLRQQREAAAPSTSPSSNHNNWEAAAAAIAAVERAMEDMPAFLGTPSSSADAAAAAGNENNTTTTATTAWTVTTPTEADEDELRECFRAYHQGEGEEEPDSPRAAATFAPSAVLRALRALGIANWRQLANADGDGDGDGDGENSLCARLHRVLAEQQHQKDSDDTNDDSGGGATPAAAAVPVSPAAVRAWIDRAQFQSVQEIMVECCGGNVDAVDLLIERMNCGTPQDLALWRTVVATLHAELTRRAAASSPDNGDDDGAAAATADVVPPQRVLQTWCDRAAAALDQLEWLQYYATPVQDA